MLVTFAGCKQQDTTKPAQDPEVQVLTVNPREIEGNSLDIIPYVEAVYLPEDKANVLLSEVSIFRPYEDFVFILDDHINTIYCLDSTFQFLYKIPPLGKGPGEFLKVSDFVYDEEQRRLTVHDNTQQKMLVYDHNGSFLEEHKLDLFSNNIIYIENKAYAFNYEYNANSYNFLLRMNKADYSIDASFFRPRFATYENLFGTYTFVKDFSGTFYHHSFDYQVYSLHEKDEPKLVYQMDFGAKAAMPQIERMSMYEAENYVRERDLVFFTNFFTRLDPKRFYFEYRMGGDIFRCIFNLETQYHRIYRQNTFGGLDATMAGSDQEGNLYMKLSISTPEEMDLIHQVIEENSHIDTNEKAELDFQPNFIIVKVNRHKLAGLADDMAE